MAVGVGSLPCRRRSEPDFGVQFGGPPGVLRSLRVADGGQGLVGFGLPDPGTEPSVDLEGLVQPPTGGCGLVEGGVEDSDPVGVGAHEADEGAIDRARARHGKQIVKEPLAEPAVMQCDGGGAHLADED